MTAIVPHFRPRLADVIDGGNPVYGDHWQALGGLANWCQGHGGMLIPWTSLSGLVDESFTGEWHFYVGPKAVAVERVWLVALRTDGATITCGSADPVTVTAPGVYAIREPLSAKTSTAGDVTLAIEAEESGFAKPIAVAMYEQTRRVLEQDTTDYGVDLTTCATRQPIADLDAGESLAAVCDAHKNLDCRRAGYFHWAAQLGSDEVPIDVTTSDVALFPLAIPCLAPVRNTGDTSLELTIAAYAMVDSGSASIDFSASHTASGETLTITSTSYAWVVGTLSVAAEDLLESNGLPFGNTWEEIEILAHNGTATTLSIAAISILRPLTAGSPI